MKPTIIVLAVVLIALPSFPKDQKREWQIGKLVSIEQGTESGPGIVSGTTTPVVIPTSYKIWTYTVETDTMVYSFREGERAYTNGLGI